MAVYSNTGDVLQYATNQQRMEQESIASTMAMIMKLLQMKQDQGQFDTSSGQNDRQIGISEGNLGLRQNEFDFGLNKWGTTEKPHMESQTRENDARANALRNPPPPEPKSEPTAIQEARLRVTAAGGDPTDNVAVGKMLASMHEKQWNPNAITPEERASTKKEKEDAAKAKAQRAFIMRALTSYKKEKAGAGAIDMTTGLASDTGALDKAIEELTTYESYLADDAPLKDEEFAIATEIAKNPSRTTRQGAWWTPEAKAQTSETKTKMQNLPNQIKSFMPSMGGASMLAGVDPQFVAAAKAKGITDPAVILAAWDREGKAIKK